MSIRSPNFDVLLSTFDWNYYKSLPFETHAHEKKTFQTYLELSKNYPKIKFAYLLNAT